MPRTCHEYGVGAESGIYTIDPLRKIGMTSKFKASCDFSTGSTIINHNQEDLIKINSCSGANCFNLSVSYNSDMDHIRSLVEISESCHQDIEFSCYLSKITNYASFTSWNGEYHAHFQGNASTRCQCSVDNSCFTIRDVNYCNCDIGDAVLRRDLIKIEDKVTTNNTTKDTFELDFHIF